MNNFLTFLDRFKEFSPNMTITTQQQQQKMGLITIATVITAYTFYRQFIKSSAMNDGTPVVPYSDSWKGSTVEFRKDPITFTKKWTEKLGLVYRIHLYGRIHTVASGKYAREVFMSDDFDFVVGTRKTFDMFGMAGIVNHHQLVEETRKAIVQHVNPQLKYYTPRVVENLTIGLQDILGELTEPKEVSNIFPLIQRMVARGSATVFVGGKLCQNDQIVSIMQNITTDIGKMHPRYHQSWVVGFPWMMKLYFKSIGMFSAEVKHQRKVILDAITPEIKMRQADARNNPNWERPKDVLQELIEINGPSFNNNNQKEFYTAMLDQLLVLIFASVHTTSENGTIVISRLLQHPEVIDELLEEQDQVLRKAGLDPNQGNSVDLFTFEIIKNMPKLDSVCRESLRLRSQFYELAHTNITKRNVVLSNGTVIPPDGDVLINVWHAHNMGEDDLTQFKPFRFVNSRYPATKVSDQFLVFGEGKHSCPGRWFAIQEIKTIVSMLIRDYKLSAPEDIIFPIAGERLPYGKVIIEKKSPTTTKTI
ncbi:cytochrome P450 [Circinella umbellata]|nr:cytochrome P450 [Circinella umbellata]